MQEQVDSGDETTEQKNDDYSRNSFRVRSPTSPERARKIPKHISSDSEEETTALGEAIDGNCSSDKNSLTKEDSGFAEKLSTSGSETVQSADMMDGIECLEQNKPDNAGDAVDKESVANMSESSTEPLFSRTNQQSRQRNYRKRSFANLHDSSNDCDNEANTSSADAAGVDPSDANSNVAMETESSTDENGSLGCYLDSDDDSSDSDSDSSLGTLVDSDENNEEEIKTPLVLLKPKPKHNWNALSEVLSRPYGLTRPMNSNRVQRSWGAKQFEQRYYRSLHAVQRLELMYKLQAHDGCVNSLCFNKTGNLLASGSDDLYINIWSWSLGQRLMSFKSGHRSNVFQSKFIPFQGDLHIASSARDGQVRLSILSPDGALVSSRQLCQHRGMVNKISLVTEAPHTILSGGDDGLVILTDIRDPRPKKIVKVQEDARKVPLNSIYCHPLLSHEFVVGGGDQFVRIYDQRNAKTPQAKFKPLSETKRLDNKAARSNIHITSALYNYNGREVLASYTDDDIFLFSNDPSAASNKSCSSRDDERDYIGRYTGHRNQATIKSVNFFGPHSEYVISGSDCSYCYIWDKKTEAIVQWFRGDESGVVNCMEPHPHIPVIATSGLDYDVKIWVPSKEEPTSLDELQDVVRMNKRRSMYLGQYDDGVTDWVDGQMLWMFLTHVHRNEFGAQREEAQGGTDNGDNAHSDSSDEDSGEPEGNLPCAPS